MSYILVNLIQKILPIRKSLHYVIFHYNWKHFSSDFCLQTCFLGFCWDSKSRKWLKTAFCILIRMYNRIEDTKEKSFSGKPIYIWPIGSKGLVNFRDLQDQSILDILQVSIIDLETISPNAQSWIILSPTTNRIMMLLLSFFVTYKNKVSSIFCYYRILTIWW